MAQLGELVGMSRPHLNNVERGKASLSRVKLYRIANTLGVDATEFLPTGNPADGEGETTAVAS